MTSNRLTPAEEAVLNAAKKVIEAQSDVRKKTETCEGKIIEVDGVKYRLQVVK